MCIPPLDQDSSNFFKDERIKLNKILKELSMGMSQTI